MATRNLRSKTQLKANIRGYKRLLATGDLPATARPELERKLKACELEMAAHAHKDKESKYHKRYKMVRFVERKKLMRLIKQMAEEVKAMPKGEEKTAATNELNELRIRLMYTRSYPVDMKYISLFPKDKGDETNNDKQNAKQNAILEYLRKQFKARGVKQIRVTRADVFGEKQAESSEEEEGPGKKKRKGGKKQKQKEVGEANGKDDFFMPVADEASGESGGDETSESGEGKDGKDGEDAVKEEAPSSKKRKRKQRDADHTENADAAKARPAKKEKMG
ncbi:18S rRNA maturation protein [Borealophlyctis nickersoniae]|nr:18S rRNA maturation protein [Borealophlyctis nickersoniae]